MYVIEMKRFLIFIICFLVTSEKSQILPEATKYTKQYNEENYSNQFNEP